MIFLAGADDGWARATAAAGAGLAQESGRAGGPPEAEKEWSKAGRTHLEVIADGQIVERIALFSAFQDPT